MRSSRLVVFALAVGFFILGASPAAADTVAGLQTDFGDGVDAPLAEDIDAELDDIFDQSHDYRWMPPGEAAEALDDDLVACFDSDCLVAVGDALDAPVGLAIDFDVEHEIYEWTVEFYDLEAGARLTTEHGTCELCGRAEVLEQFRASVHGNLVTLDSIAPEEPTEPIEPRPEAGPDTTEVQIRVTPPDARIFLDDEPVGEGQAQLELEEGSHDIRFSHDTHHGLREEIVITEDSAPLFVLRINLSEGDTEQRRVITRGDGLVDQIETHRPAIGWTAVGVGAVLTISSYFLARLHGQPTCGPDVDVRRCPDVYTTAGLATTSAVVGTAGLAAGSALLTWPLLAGDAAKPTDADIEAAATTDGDFAGFSIRGRF